MVGALVLPRRPPYQIGSGNSPSRILRPPLHSLCGLVLYSNCQISMRHSWCSAVFPREIVLCFPTEDLTSPMFIVPLGNTKRALVVYKFALNTRSHKNFKSVTNHVLNRMLCSQPKAHVGIRQKKQGHCKLEVAVIIIGHAVGHDLLVIKSPKQTS